MYTVKYVSVLACIQEVCIFDMIQCRGNAFISVETEKKVMSLMYSKMYTMWFKDGGKSTRRRAKSFLQSKLLQ